MNNIDLKMVEKCNEFRIFPHYVENYVEIILTKM